jgi:hypothetical protein
MAIGDKKEKKSRRQVVKPNELRRPTKNKNPPEKASPRSTKPAI